MRTVFLGTSEFAAAVLDALASSPHRPELVVTRPDRPRGRGRRLASPPVADAARRLEIELDQPQSVNDPEARARIAAAAPEVVCVCAFGALIKEPLLSDYELLNVHPSLLPRWRGAAPIERAMMAGDERTGVSIMRVTAGLDSGPVCSRAIEPILPDDTYGTLSGRLEALGGTLLIEALDRRPPCAAQDDAGATYADKLTADDRLLDGGRSAVELERLVRALSPHVGAAVQIGDGTRLGVWEARALDLPGPAPGELSLSGSLPVLGCAVGSLELVVVQPPGRRAMPGADYLRGRRELTVDGVSPARACAFAVVRRVFEHDAYADRALAAEAKGLAPRERSLAMSLAYGTVQRRATLDYVAARFCARPLRSLEPGALAALRIGILQLLYLDGIAEHAAVHESVELAKQSTRGGAGLVNAVLRRTTREGREVLDSLSDETPAGAATVYSVPQWLAELWWLELGADQARALLAHVNDPAESALRVNTLVASRDAVAVELPVASRTVAELPEALVLDAPFDVQGSELFARGAVMAQARASMLAGRALAPAPGARVLDLCAAPGAKTTQLGALIEDRGELVAVERHPGRAAALGETLARMRVGCARVQVADAGAFDEAGRYDAVLVDPPCSGLGTLQSRPDLRWRTSPERIAALSDLQARILRAGANATAPGGALVYSVCTISRAEGVGVVESLVRERTDFELEDLTPMLPAAGVGPFLQTLPSRDGTDGFFIARLRRKFAVTGRVSL